MLFSYCYNFYTKNMLKGKEIPVQIVWVRLLSICERKAEDIDERF